MLFDSFLVRSTSCPHCRRRIDNVEFQSKQFGGMLDFITEGEDVRNTVPGWFIYKDSAVNGGLTVDEAERLARKDPLRFRLTISHEDGRETPKIEEFIGHHARSFSGIKDAIFTVYTQCPRCHKRFDSKAKIADYVFTGLE